MDAFFAWLHDYLAPLAAVMALLALWPAARALARRRRGLPRALRGLNAGHRHGRARILALGDAGLVEGVLASPELRRAYGQPELRPGGGETGLRAWWLEGGLVLEPCAGGPEAGRYRPPDATEWEEALREVRRLHRRRPAGGVLLLLHAGELVDPSIPEAKRLAELTWQAVAVRERLDRAQRVLGMGLPVYVLIAGCEALPGFAEAAGAVPRERRGQILGWSAPGPPAAPYSPGWIDGAIAEIRDAVEASQLGAPEPEGPPPGLMLPLHLRRLAEPLRVYAAQVFTPRAGSEPPRLRGVYLCGRAAGEPGGAGPAFATDVFHRKLFAEPGTARPIRRVLAAARLKRLAFAALIALAAAWLGAGMLHGRGAVRETAAAAEPYLRGIDRDIGEVRAGRYPSLAAAGDLLSASETMPSLRLREATLPASWLSLYPGRVERAVAAGFEALVFGPIRARLAGRVEALIDAPPAAAGGERPLDGVASYLDELDRVEALVAAHDAFASGAPEPVAQLGRLSGELLGAPLSVATPEAARGLASALDRVRVPAFDLERLGYAQPLREAVAGRVRSALDALFGDQGLAVDLQRARRALSDLAPTYASYRALRDALAGLSADLERPEARWLLDRQADLGPRFDALVQRVRGSALLGPELAWRLRRDAARYLGGLPAGAGLPDLVGSAKDGAPVLSEHAQGLLDALQAILAQPFMREAGPGTLHSDWTPAQRLTWDPGPLKQVSPAYEQYQGYPDAIQAYLDEKGLQALPSPLRQTHAAMARQAAAALIAGLLAEAQGFSAAAGGRDPKVLEQAIEAQVGGLQAVEGPLADAMNAFEGLQAWPQAAALERALDRQRGQILAALDRLLQAYGPYRPRDGGFDWWDGEAPPAGEAFGLDGDAAPYLDRQRGLITKLSGELAQPVLGLAGLPAPQDPAAARWAGIATALQDYANQAPASAIEALESFISGELSELTVYTCFERPRRRGASRGGYFRERLDRLRRQLHRRCHGLADEKGYALYRALAARFDQRLAGRFPFAPAGAAEPADPRALRELFDQDYEHTLTLVRQIPEPSRRFGAQRGAVQAFMNRLDLVRTFFAAYLASGPEAAPAFDLDVRFRVVREAERGANQVTWTMDIGDQRLDLASSRSVVPPSRHLPIEADATWVSGSPVTLSLAWAAGSRVLPIKAWRSPEAAVDGGTVRYRYTGPWALLRLLQAHPAGQEYAGRVPGEAVQLRVATARKGKPEEQGLARMFMRVVLLAPGTTERLPLPRFPHQAAAVGPAP